MRAGHPNIGLQRTAPCGLAAEAASLGVGRKVALFGTLVVLAGCAKPIELQLSIRPKDEYAVFWAVACDRGAIVIVGEARPPRGIDRKSLKFAIRSLLVPNEVRPAISEDTLRAFEDCASEPSITIPPLLLECPSATVLTPAEIRKGNIGTATSFSRVGFNRHGTQALVLVTRHVNTNWHGWGTRSSLVFLTRPNGPWVVVGVAPWSIV